MTLYYNGNVVTMGAKHSRATAFTVHGDRITAVGNDDLADTDAAVDLHGRTVVPGFVDAHPHTVHRAMDTLYRPSIAGARCIGDITARVAAQAADTAPGEWIVTSPLGEPPDYSGMPGTLAENRWPTRHDLDAAAPDNPVLIPATAFWPNPAVLNSSAMAALGVTAATADEPGARLLRDADGEPTGVVKGLTIYQMGAALMQKLLPHLPRPSGEPLRAAIVRACEQNLAVGVTACYEGHGTFSAADLRALADDGRLPHRFVCAYEIPARAPLAAIEAWFAEHADAAGAGTGDDLLHVRGATLSLDGPPHFGLSHMDTTYLDSDDEPTNGTSAVDSATLAAIAGLAVDNDMRLGVMAAGSAACALTVDALAAVHARTPLTGKDWLLQHFFYPPRHRIAELAAMGLSVQTLTSIDYSRGEEVYVRRVGGESWRALSPLRWWIDAGVPVAVGSDGAHYDPLFQLWATLSRVDGATGNSLRTTAKTVTRDEALAALTRDAAVVLGAADRIGSLEPGKLADFVVLDNDILTCPLDAVRATTALATAVGGTVRHDPGRILAAAVRS